MKADIYRFCAEEPLPTGLARYRRDPELTGTKTKRQTKVTTAHTEHRQKEIGHSRYDRNDREGVPINLKDHKPKSATGYSQYSSVYLRLLKPEPTDRPPPRHKLSITSGLE